MEYFDWLEQEAEGQRREKRREQAQRFLPLRDTAKVGGLGHVSAGLLLWLESSESDEHETDTDDGREACNLRQD